MQKRSIQISTDYINHPAQNGSPRWGVIRKELKIYSPSNWFTCSATHSIVGVEINTLEKTIAVHYLKGSMPYANNLFWALLADRDVRRLIENYQVSGRNVLYKVWSSIGSSGREDIFLTLGDRIGGFATTKTIHLCHISSCGRLNEGFGDRNSKMYIGDFVELVCYMGLTEDMNTKVLRRKAQSKYLKPKFMEELEDYTTQVSRIL